MPLDYADHIVAARTNLTQARRALGAEISGYPTPIAGWDAQFNYLLAERQKVLEALRTLEKPVFVPTPRTPSEGVGVESR